MGAPDGLDQALPTVATGAIPALPWHLERYREIGAPRTSLPLRLHRIERLSRYLPIEILAGELDLFVGVAQCIGQFHRRTLAGQRVERS